MKERLTMDLKYVTGPITKADAGGLEAVITTPKVDSDGESVDPKGIVNRDDWLSNPLIYWAHEWAFDPSAEPVGKGTRLDVFGDRIESAAVYAPTPKAQNVRALVAGGFVRKTSIGFDPMEMADVKGIPTHTRWALREWSIVPMPANTDATITGTKAALRWLADEIAEPLDEDAPNVITVRLDASKLLAAMADLDNLSLSVDDGAVALRDGKRVIAGIRRRRVLISVFAPPITVPGAVSHKYLGKRVTRTTTRKVGDEYETTLAFDRPPAPTQSS